MINIIQSSPICQTFFEDEPPITLAVIARCDDIATQTNLYLTQPLEAHLSYAGSALAAVIGTAIKIVGLFVGIIGTLILLPALICCPNQFSSIDIDEDLDDSPIIKFEFPYIYDANQEKISPKLSNPLFQEKWDTEIESTRKTLTKEIRKATPEYLEFLSTSWEQLVQDANLLLFFDKIYKTDYAWETIGGPVIWPDLNLNPEQSCVKSIRDFMQNNQIILKKIIYLGVSDSALTQLPKEITLFENLCMFGINENHLKELPPEFFQMISLKTFSVANNQIEEIPPEIGNLVNLESAAFDGNPLKKISSFKPLINLISLWMDEDCPQFEYNNRITRVDPPPHVILARRKI